MVLIFCFWGSSKSEKCGCFPLPPPLNGGDFDHGKVMRPEMFQMLGDPTGCVWIAMMCGLFAVAAEFSWNMVD